MDAVLAHLRDAIERGEYAVGHKLIHNFGRADKVDRAALPQPDRGRPARMRLRAAV